MPQPPSRLENGPVRIRYEKTVPADDPAYENGARTKLRYSWTP